MTQYLTDFSEYTAGVAPSDWTDRWAGSWTTNVVTGVMPVGAIGGKTLELDRSADGRGLLSWDDLDGDVNRDDVEILTRVAVSAYSSGDYCCRVFARATGTSGNETGYYVEFYLHQLRLQKYVNSTNTNLASYSPTDLINNLDDNPFWIRFRVNGSSLKAKTWSVHKDEPDAWQIEETDTGITAAGWVGVGRFSDAQSDYVDYFAAGTNGDSPAFPLTTTGAIKLNAMHVEAALEPASAPEVRLNAMHVEAALAAEPPEVRISAMHLEVAYVAPSGQVTGMPLICINT